ncbi:MAG TPA: aminomethyl-transferring glycine dehydrogenase subunit GcvPA [Dehalococcoidia bacterium]|nr:aminomethyl-transferring glycine dehydrogenase subunit GcvPA [Dehalococcoidia bacterium]
MPHPYLPATDADRERMLRAIGVSSVEELFADIPAEHRRPRLDLPPPLSEPELARELAALAAKNRTAGELACFRGGGAYRHFVPAAVSAIVSRGEFATSYTPYQPEVSQGTLQGIFEFQSIVCELTGMDVANAGMYDGASALAEACLMACAVTGRRRVAVSRWVNPRAIETLRTYASGRGYAIDLVDDDGLESGAVTQEHACLAVQQPDYFGRLSPATDAWGRAAHAVRALYVVSASPVSLGLVRPPGAYGADIVVGEGQALGAPLSFGGPYVGLFACRQELLRHMPGRIVGRTRDLEGRTGYVLTLQTREQHIRRERATSNICTSQQLIALAFAVTVCLLGKQGLRRMAELCYHKAHYTAERIAELPGFRMVFDGPFFNEFAVACPRPVREINGRLLERGILGGLDVSPTVDGSPLASVEGAPEHAMLLAVTELNTRDEIDALVEALREI